MDGCGTTYIDDGMWPVVGDVLIVDVNEQRFPRVKGIGDEGLTVVMHGNLCLMVNNSLIGEQK
jgi:hypothetical protein